MKDATKNDSSRHQRWTGYRVDRLRDRGEEGNLVVVVILVAVMALVVGIAVATLAPTFGVAHTSQTGEQAVAQANAGLSDALFHLDQLGDNAASFCVGNPPANLLSAANLASCYVTGTSPLPSAPGLRYYVVAEVAGALPAGITQELKITSYAKVSGQARMVTSLIYRVEDSFGMFGVSGISANGALKQANVYEVGGYPVSSFQQSGTVDVGIGPYGAGNCNGNSSGSSIVTVGQNGTINNGCPAFTATQLNLDPADPTTCASGQVSTAFAPCIDTSSFATYSGSTYCPLMGTGIPNTVALTTAITPPASAVYNCATNGAAVTIGCVGTKKAPCSTTSCASLPFGLSTIPPGSYYFDSNAVTVGELDASCFGGEVSIYDLPAACGSNACPLYTPTSSTNAVGGGSQCQLPPNANTNVSLELSGPYVNASSPSSSPFDFTPGNPSNFNLYWSGNNAVTVDKGLVYDGSFYAPGAIWTTKGQGYETFGTITANCIGVDGSPNLYFVYPEHPQAFLKNWAVSNYSITP